ncbi:MAG: hypothetical protein KAY65_09195 [Planctomycetes bacterium]|nr:hypothetical protein [Planctomycetota bacterium]
MMKAKSMEIERFAWSRGVQWIRWAVLICQQVVFTPVVLLLLLPLFVGIHKAEPYIEWYFSTRIFEFIVLPMCFANGINGFVMMVEGRIKAKWKWWKQIFTIFAISIPIYGAFHYTKCKTELKSLATQSSIN